MDAPIDTDALPTMPVLEKLRNGPLTLSVEEASRYLGVSRSQGYLMIRAGRLPAVYLSERRKRVPTIALIRLLEGQ